MTAGTVEPAARPRGRFRTLSLSALSAVRGWRLGLLRIATHPAMAVSITGAGFATINDGCGGTLVAGRSVLFHRRYQITEPPQTLKLMPHDRHKD